VVSRPLLTIALPLSAEWIVRMRTLTEKGLPYLSSWVSNADHADRRSAPQYLRACNQISLYCKSGHRSTRRTKAENTAYEPLDITGVIDTPPQLVLLSNIVDPNLVGPRVSLTPSSKPRKGHTQRAFFLPVHCEYWKNICWESRNCGP
jgi:hypothetical protein